MKEKSFLVVLIAACVVLGVYIYGFQGERKNEVKDCKRDVYVENGIKKATVAEPESIDVAKLKGWEYNAQIDPMTDKEIKFARLVSDNYINQEMPYGGDTYMAINIRKKGTTDIYLTIDRGQILGESYNETNKVLVRFGESSPVRFRTCKSDDGSSDIIFVCSNTQKFVNLCKKNKDIKIEIPIYQYGNAIFLFHVDEMLEWK